VRSGLLPGNLASGARQGLASATTDASGTTIADLAARAKADPSDVSRVLPLAFLSRKIVSDIVTGRQSIDLTAQRLFRLTDLLLSWEEQHQVLCA